MCVIRDCHRPRHPIKGFRDDGHGRLDAKSYETSHRDYCVYHIRLCKWAVGLAPRKGSAIIDYADPNDRILGPIDTRQQEPHQEPMGAQEIATLAELRESFRIGRALILADMAEVRPLTSVEIAELRGFIPGAD